MQNVFCKYGICQSAADDEVQTVRAVCVCVQHSTVTQTDCTQCVLCTNTQASLRRCLCSEYHKASLYTRKCSLIYTIKKSLLFPATIFVKFTKAEQRYLLMY